ncbi:hypothetical protein ACFWHF_35220 [Streptomyces griseoincarnatus]
MTTGMSIWGSVPTWITALVGCATFLYTATLFKRTSQDRVRDQAAKVTVQAMGNVAYVRNDSDLPIFEIFLVIERGPEANPDYLHLQIESHRIVNSAAKCAIPLLVPHEEFTAGMPPGLPDGSRIVGIEFADAHGRFWLRDIVGRLKKTRRRFRGQRPKFVADGPASLLTRLAPVFPKGSDKVVGGTPTPQQVNRAAGLVPSQRTPEGVLTQQAAGETTAPSAPAPRMVYGRSSARHRRHVLAKRLSSTLHAEEPELPWLSPWWAPDLSELQDGDRR